MNHEEITTADLVDRTMQELREYQFVATEFDAAPEFVHRNQRATTKYWLRMMLNRLEIES